MSSLVNYGCPLSYVSPYHFYECSAACSAYHSNLFKGQPIHKIAKYFQVQRDRPIFESTDCNCCHKPHPSLLCNETMVDLSTSEEEEPVDPTIRRFLLDQLYSHEFPMGTPEPSTSSPPTVGQVPPQVPPRSVQSSDVVVQGSVGQAQDRAIQEGVKLVADSNPPGANIDAIPQVPAENGAMVTLTDEFLRNSFVCVSMLPQEYPIDLRDFLAKKPITLEFVMELLE